ncbi:signal recognition particle-docking protein FtsY [Faecalibacillus intestinalis]|uniref:signal recognition particle-docking protein FtsY n=1 Tax=Faecalibacillus intestinalis TaxID=1982626 RepID=UPI000E49587F|nr:signal recognition particle-docking protein FtsY [Faecalibacillus intestinalis]RHP55780.1 signal recognition particle-docking protein FtsY [Coprobacillus sp. AF31-1BH]RHP78562.1 signal recognition particle-docking protein FtsY [Coprobacillus sp. OF03-2AA]
MGFFTQIKEKLVGKSTKQNEKYVVGLDKSSETFSDRINELAARFREINDEYFEELENILIMADVGVSMVMKIVSEIKTEVRIRNITDPREINDIIVDKMFVIYANESVMSTKINYAAEGLTVILMVGVNGAGKTTTIGKLAHRIVHDEGKKVVVAAGDTFRAGAIDQLAVWAERVGVDIVKGKEGGDPSAVVFDALNKAKETGADVLICDTAGRLQNKVNLMNELEKMNRIIKRVVPEGPHETLLVVDATTGQNGVSQAIEFSKITDITGIVLTKMDGTAKGGIVLSIKDQLNIPVKFIGLGEQVDDLQEFDLEQYIYGLCKGLIEEA